MLDVFCLHKLDSVRKRMSFIIGFPDNTVKMFVKGSDTSMCLAFWQMTMKATLALRIQLTVI
jgi:magnesium-transporting ATPase (P-type)